MTEFKSASGVAFCDHRAHVQYIRSAFPQVAVLATTPDAAWECQRQNVAYHTFDEFVSPADVNALAEETTRREYEWAQWFDHELGRLIPAIAESRFEPARANLSFLKRTFDNFVLPAKILSDFFRLAQPSVVYVFSREPFYPGLAALRAERPLFSLLAGATAPESVNVIELTDVIGLPHMPAPPAVPVTLPMTMPRLLRGVRNQMRKVIAQFRQRWASAHANCARIGMFGSAAYELDEFAMNFGWFGAAAVRFPRKSRHDVQLMPVDMEGVWLRISSNPRFWDVLDRVNSRLRVFAEPFFRWWVVRELPSFWSAFQQGRLWIANERLDAVVGVEVQSPATAALFNAARSVGVTSFASIHNPPGGAIDLPAQDCLGPIQADYYLVNGSGDVNYFDDLGRRFNVFPRGQNLPVGSPRLESMERGSAARQGERLRRRLRKHNNSKPIVVYVATSFRGAYRHFNEGYISDGAYFQLQQRILRALAESPKVRVLYKGLTSWYERDPVPDYVSGLGIEQTNEPLSELMRAADALIIDFPSTAIAEVLITDKPVLLFSDRHWARMLPAAREALYGRVVIAETPDEFESKVREFCATGMFPSMRRGDAFLRLYGTHEDDGRSAIRGAEQIVNIVRRSSQLERPELASHGNR